MERAKRLVAACALVAAGFGGYLVRDVTDTSPKYLVYIIERDDRGKFGYTEKSHGESIEEALFARWRDRDFRLYWTKVLPTREAALEFERWAKTEVQINYRREYFPVGQIEHLVEKSESRYR